MGAQLVITALNAHTSVHHRQHAAAIVAQLEAMFCDDEGWIEAWHGYADPSTPARIILDKDQANRWYWLTSATRPELVRLLLDWAARYGNAYISTTLYSRPARGREWTLPSRLVFVDDAPEHAALPYSMAVETSADKRQAYYVLHTPVDAATRQDLQRRIAYALHADKSGHDPEQLGRVASTWNTKHNKQHPVTLTYADGPRYSVDELAAQFPPVAHAAAAALEVDDQELAHWLGNVDAIMRRIRPGTPTSDFIHGDGGNNRSNTRWAVAGYLRKHFGLPSVEIAAVLLRYCDWGHSREKGSAWLYADVMRCVAGAEEKYPHAIINPTRGRQARPPVVLPEVPRQPRGRPRTCPIDSFYQALVDEADCGKVMQTQPQLAARFGKTEQTIRRWEKELHGKVKRHKTADKQGSYLEIVRPFINTDAAENEDAAAADVLPDVLSKIPERSIDARTHEVNTPPPEQTPAAPSPDPEPLAAAATYPALAVAMREAFDAYHDAGRITRRRIRDYLEANYPDAPWSDAALRYWYGELLKQRQRDRGREKLLADLPSMPHAKLRRLERRCDRLLADGPDGPHGKQYHFARWAAPLVADELASERRRAAMERTKVRRGRRPDPAPKVTEVDTTPPLLALVDVPQDASSEADGLEPPWTAGTLMEACAGDGVPVPPEGSLAAVCFPLPAGPTAPTIEFVEPRPAAATRSQAIVRPDLYARYATERRAAAAIYSSL